MKLIRSSSLFVLLGAVFFSSCSAPQNSVSANLLDDGIYYDPDIEIIPLSQSDEILPTSENADDEFDYYDPDDVNYFPEEEDPIYYPQGNPWSWGMGSAGFYDPFYSPFGSPFSPMMTSPGWNMGMGYNTMTGWQFSLGYGFGNGFGNGFGMYPGWGMGNPYYGAPYNPWAFGFPASEVGGSRGNRINAARPNRTITRTSSSGSIGNSGKTGLNEDQFGVGTRRTGQSRTASSLSRSSRTSRSSRSQVSTKNYDTEERLRVKRKIQRSTRDNSSSSRNVVYDSPSERDSRGRDTYRGKPAVRTTNSPSRDMQEIFRSRDNSNAKGRQSKNWDFFEMNRSTGSGRSSSGTKRSSGGRTSSPATRPSGGGRKSTNTKPPSSRSKRGR